MGALLLTFIAVPAIELWLLIEVGARIGSLATIGLIIITGTIGAALARREGLGVLAKIRADTSQGLLPTDALFDGVVILLAGALLITPGMLTDVFGFACLVPGFRRLMKHRVRKWIERRVELGQASFTFMGGRGPGPNPFMSQNPDPSARDPRPGPVIDVSPPDSH